MRLCRAQARFPSGASLPTGRCLSAPPTTSQASVRPWAAAGLAGLAAGGIAGGWASLPAACEDASPAASSSAGAAAKGAAVAAAVAAAAAAYGLREDGSYGPMAANEADRQRKQADRLQLDADTGSLPTFTLAEFQRHTSEDSLWVSYAGAVYDVTGFVGEHPGGREALLSGGGQDLEVVWSAYRVHFDKDVLQTLAPYRIGSLSDDDARSLRAGAASPGVPATGALAVAAQRRAASRAARRSLQVWALTATLPFWWCLRGLVGLVARLIPLVGPLAAEWASRPLPCSVPGLGGAEQLAAVDPKTREQVRIAVIGGGIGGVACAYSLRRSGYHVTIYESRSQLGGNAQTATFSLGGANVPVTQDLSVLYWAPEYYRNYSALMSELGLTPAKVQLPYVVRCTVDGQSQFYTQPGGEAALERLLQPSLEGRFASDLRRYDRMIAAVTATNNLFSWGSSRTSFYRTNQYSLLPFANPLNYIGMRDCARLFGLSSDFFECILRPFHGINLSTIHFDSAPAAGYQVLDDIAPLHKSRWVCTWGVGNSKEVFQRATADCEVLLDTRVRQVSFQSPCAGRGWRQLVVDDKGAEREFDRVVFACPAAAAENMLRPTGWLERTLLRGVGYHDELQRADWRDWLEAQVHQDPSCLPEQHRAAILEKAAFVADVRERGAAGSRRAANNVEYTHNLGAFSPSAVASGVSPAERTMFMTQCHHAGSEYRAEQTVGSFSAPRAHPDLSYTNLVVTQLLHLVQGRRGVWYCSNWTAPGNGHDLACTSGLAVAGAIGASYPFACAEAKRDHRDCRRFMCI